MIAYLTGRDTAIAITAIFNANRPSAKTILLSPQSDGQDHVFELITAVGGDHYAG